MNERCSNAIASWVTVSASCSNSLSLRECSVAFSKDSEKAAKLLRRSHEQVGIAIEVVEELGVPGQEVEHATTPRDPIKRPLYPLSRR